MRGPVTIGRWIVLAAALLLAGCEEESVPSVEGGTAALGPPIIARPGCGSCHRIPGIPGATGRTGPPLDAVGRQAYVAGVVPNEPERLVRFILDPHATDPRSAIPALGLTEEEARHVAAFLYAPGTP